MPDEQWIDVGSVEELKQQPLQEVSSGRTIIALTYKDGSFAAISGVCNHVGGPLGEGTLDGDYVVCPWHYWKFHHKTGQGEPGHEQDHVPSYTTRDRERPALYRSLVRHEAEEAAPQTPSARTSSVAAGRPGPRRGDLDDGDDRRVSQIQHLRHDAGRGARPRPNCTQAGDPMYPSYAS